MMLSAPKVILPFYASMIFAISKKCEKCNYARKK